MAANRVVPTGLQCTYAFAKNRFHAPLPQVQSYPLPVLVEPMPAEYVLSPTAVSQLQMAELPPLLTNTSPIGSLSNVGNNGFAEAEESSG